jgi:uncharacterized protein YfaS (alpha-2-macroglobulin family)
MSNDFNKSAGNGGECKENSGETLLKAEEKIKNLAFKDAPARIGFREELMNRILALRHCHFSMSHFFSAVMKKLIAFSRPKVYVPIVASLLVIALGLNLLSPLLSRYSGDNPWSKLSELLISPAYAQDNFTATATAGDALGVASTTAFIIKSKDKVDESLLKQNIKLTPDDSFTLEKIDDNTFKVIPHDPLEGKTVYNLKITSAYLNNGATVERDYSWAFQVKDIFKVLTLIPSDQASNVPLDTGIELTFSHDNLVDYEKAFKIEPAVEGKFEVQGRTLVFVPKKLDAGVIYKVTVDKDILKIKNSDSKLASDYVLQFETDPSGKLRGEYSEFNFQNSFNEIYTEREPALAVSVYNIKQEKFPVEVYAFPSADSFVEALKKNQQTPYWAQYNRTVYRTDTSGLSKVSSFNIPLTSYGDNKYLVFPDKLSKGFYLTQINVNGVLIQTFLEVSDLTDYTSVSSNNTLVWLNNIKTKKPVSGAKVSVIGTNNEAVTGVDGVATLPSDWLVASSTADSVYLLVDAGEETVIPVSYNHTVYTAKNAVASSYNAADDYWYYFYTDRLTYLPGDTANYWGFIKPRSGAISSEKVTIKIFSWQGFYDYYNNPVPLYATDTPLAADSTFTGKLPLGRLSSGYYNVQYYVGDTLIGSRGLSIEDYQKPAYKLEASPAKLALFAGDKQTVGVKASFFEGTPVPNLSIKGVNSELKTDEKGEVAETFAATADTYSDYVDTCSYYSPTAAEQADISSGACYKVFNYDVVHSGDLTKSDQNAQGNSQAKLKISLKKVDIAKANVENATEDEFLHEPATGYKVHVSLIETTYQAVRNGEYYDFVNKVVRPTYTYNEINKNIASTTGVTDSSGEYQYTFTAQKDHSYKTDVIITDANGKKISSNYYLYNMPTGYYGNSNVGYELTFKDQDKTEFSIGDNVALQFKTNNYSGEENLLSAGTGDFLYYRLFNGLTDYQIGSEPEYDFSFPEKFLPGVYVVGVYFDGETYHRSGGSAYWSGLGTGLYVSFKQSDRKLNIEVSSDKDKYQPGGDVKLKVKVTDKDGKPVQASVNLNLVDEAYYAVYPESVNALGGLYNNRVDQGELATYISNPAPKMSAYGAEGGGCFLGGTKITMADRTVKNIEDVKIGDKVLTFADETGKSYATEEVVKTYEHQVGEYLVINGYLNITPIHRVFLNGQWQMIGEAKVGDWLLNENGEKVRIDKIEYKYGLFKVYNLTVDPYHTFFADKIYVHNDKGSGTRSLFADTAVFLNLNTAADGTASAEFNLPDNITAWRVTAQAFTANLYAGDKTIDLNSSLPAFVSTSFAKEYLTADQIEVKVRAYGDSLSDGDDVAFKMEASTLNYSSAQNGKAFAASYFDLPQLSTGTHALTTSIKSGQYQDAVKENIKVVDTRFKETKTSFYELSDSLKPSGSANGLTTLIFSDKNQGRFYDQLEYCYDCGGDRVDQKMARAVSVDLLQKYFGETADKEDFKGSVYQNDDGGIGLLPYASSDFELSAKAAFLAGDYFDKQRLINYFYKILSADDSTREQVGVALFALSGLGEPVLVQAENYASLSDLNDKEKLYIAIALSRLGDTETAHSIYEQVLQAKGEKMDQYLRIKESDDQDEILSLTSLAAILAGSLGVSDHEQLWNYVARYYTKNILIDLEKLIYVSETLPRLTPGEVSFTVNLPAQKIDKTLKLGEQFRMQVTAADLASISFTNIKGEVGLESVYSAPEANITPKSDANVFLNREYYVNGIKTDTLKQSDMVEIRMYPTFSKTAPTSTYQITDFLPSGLTVNTGLYYRGQTYSCSDYYPYDVTGQTVKFYISKDYLNSQYCNRNYFSYYVRVNSPGKYQAESAVIQSMDASSVKNYSSAGTITIEK